MDHNDFNGNEDINFGFIAFSISRKVLGVVEAESCIKIYEGPANFKVELISAINDLINVVFMSYGDNYMFINITPIMNT